MDLNTAANALRELGHPTRLSIYRELVRAGHEGLPVGELQKHLEIPASTLSHHLSADIRWTALLQIVGGDKLIIPLLMELHMNPFKGRHFQRDIILWATLVLQIRHQLP